MATNSTTSRSNTTSSLSTTSSIISSSSLPVTTTASEIISTTTTPTPTPSTTTSYVSLSPTSTVYVPPSTTSSSLAVVSSTVLVNPGGGSSSSVAIIIVTSTQGAVTITPSNTQQISTASSSSSTPSILSSTSKDNGGSGLNNSGKIAIAVIIPIIVVALLFGLGLFLWRKRRERQNAEEQRKDDMAEYGFNPNNDPTLVPVGAAAYTDGGSEADDGYRGWGTTSSNNRKASTTLGSNGKAPNVAAYSDTMSGHPESVDGIGALGGAAVGGTAAAAAMASRNNRTSQAGIQRGPSNASSSYSHNAHSEASSDGQGIVNYYQDEVPYNIYNDVAPSHGPYGEAPYAAPAVDQPVIRDVQARRNTRIERVPTFPQTQGGISQNF